MTFFLIVAIVAICISLYQAGNIAQKKKYEKGNFNLELQKELYTDFYKSTIADIEELFENPNSVYRQTFDSGKQELYPEVYYCEALFHFLKKKYGLPIIPAIDKVQYNKELQDFKGALECYREFIDVDQKTFYFTDKNKEVLKKIFLGNKLPPADIEVLFNQPNTKKLIPEEYWSYYGLKESDFKPYEEPSSSQVFEYDDNGFIVCKHRCYITVQSFFDIVAMRTRKKMFEDGYEFVARFEIDSRKQKRIRTKGTAQEIKDYPWYYGKDFIW